MAAEFNIRDLEAANQLHSKLTAAVSDLVGTIRAMQTISQDLPVYTMTLGLNDGAKQVFDDITPQLEKCVPELENILKNLHNSISANSTIHEQIYKGNAFGKI